MRTKINERSGLRLASRLLVSLLQDSMLRFRFQMVLMLAMVVSGTTSMIGLDPVVVASGLGVAYPATYPQDEPPGADEVAIDAELKSKALRYHQALQRRPAPGFLFDRFVDGWLEFSTLADLEQFLQQQVEANKKTNDQVLLALFYAKQGDDVKALAQFQTALANDPGSAATWFEKAAVAARTLDFDTALQDLKKAAELHAAASTPDKELGLNIAKQQASLLVRSSRIADATQAWETLLAANPTDELLLEDIVEQQIAEGLFEQALGTTERLVAITKDPYQWVMRRMRQGDILQRSGKQPEALQVYGETLPRVGRDSWLERELIAQIAEMFRREDNFLGLKEQFEKLIAAEPDRLALHKGLARTLADIGQSDEAIAALEKVVELTPGDRANRENLIGALAKAGRLDAAVAQQEALIGQFPNDPELSINLAGYQKQLGREELARATMQDYLKKAGSSEAAYLRAARVSESFGWSEETSKLYQECMARFAESSVAREAYGTWLYQQNDKKAALELWLQMANGADKTELLRIARQLAQRNEHAAVITLLTSRLDSFDTDPNYLGQLIESSLATKQFAETIPWLRRRAMISRTSTEMESTIAQGTIVYRRLEQPLAFLDALRGDVADGSGAIRATGLGAACLLSELLELGGDSQAADQMLTGFEAGLSASPDATSAVEVLGVQRIRLWSMRREWAKAAEAARKLVEIPGGRQSAHLRRLVELYMRDGQPEQALAWTAQWKKSSPGSATPWVTESQLLSRLNREDESLRVLRQAARRFPQDSDLAAMLAEKYTNAGQAREAERIYWRQYEQSQDPTDRLRWVEQLARISLELGKTDELVALFRERQKSNPESIEPLLSLALVYREADNYEDRRAVLMEASRKQPENLQLLLETARLEESSGDWQDAIATLERAMPLDPSGKVARQLAKISFSFGDSERGLQLLKNQMNDPSIGPREVEGLIDSLLQADQWEMARELLLPQVTRWPDDWRLAYVQGVIELHLQAHDTAREIFRRLLVVDNDLPGVTKPIGGSVYGGFGYGGPSYEMPTGLEVFRELQYRSDEPLAHEQQDSYRGSGGSFLMLPDDAQVCRYYALLQLVFLNAEDGDTNDDRIGIARVTGAGGFENADMYFDLLLGTSPDGRRVRPDFSDELFERYRDRTDFCVLYAFLNLENDASPDEDKLMSAITKFEEQYPGPAFACLARFASRDFETTSADVKLKLTVLLDRLAESKMDFLLLQTSGHLMQGDASHLPEGLRELRSKLAELFAKWHNSIDGSADPMVHSELATVVIGSAIENRSATQLVELLERELDRAPQQVASGNTYANPYRSQYSPYGYGPEEELIEPLPFLPTDLMQVSDVFGVFQNYMIRSPRSYDDESIVGESEGSELLRQVIQQTSRPFLKAFLQMLDGLLRERNQGEERDVAYADAKLTLESLLESEPKNWNALVLAASLATHQQRWGDAASLLERMAAFPLSQDQRLTVDSAAVAVAVKGQTTDLDQPEHAGLVATARNAALRLRRHHLEPSQRYELMLALETLKLNEEAGQMESRLSQSNSTTSGGIQSVPGMMVPTFRNNRSEPVDPIVKLLREDKKDAALRLVAQGLTTLGRQRLSSFDMLGEDDYEQREFVEMINKLDLGSSLVQHLSETSPDKLELLGFAHELFGDTAQSIDLYGQYCDANPGRAAVRLRCLLLKLKESPADVEEHLQDLDFFDAKTMREVGPRLLQRLGAGPAPLELTFDQRVYVIERLIGKVEQDSSDKLENAVWLESAWSVVTEPTAIAAPKSDSRMEDRTRRPRQEVGIEQLFSGVDKLANRLPHLYKPRAKNEVTVEELPTQELKDWHTKLANAQQQRVAIHDRLTKLMLQIPQTAELAFTHWLALREAQATIEAPSAIALAKSVLESVAKIRGGQSGNVSSFMAAQRQAMQQAQLMMRYRFPGSYDETEAVDETTVPLRTPIQYLTRQLATERSAANDSQITEMAATLRGLRRNDLATELERRYELQVALPDEFAAVVARMVDVDKKARQSNAPDTAGLCLEIYSDRNLEVDLLPTLFSLARDAVQENAWSRVEQLRPMIGQYLSHRTKTAGPTMLLEVLTQFAEILCGDAERQATLIAKYGGKPNMPPTRGEGAAYASYVQTLEEFGQFPELGIPVMLEVARFKAYNYVSVRHYADSYAYFLAGERDTNKVLAYFEMGAFLSDIDDFDPIPWSVEESKTVLGTLYEGFRGNNPGNKRRLIKALKAREQTFGTRLFITILESTYSMPNKSELHKAIKPDLESLRSLSDERLAVFAAFVKELGESRSFYSSQGSADQGDPDVVAVLDRGISPTSQFEKIMAAKSLKDLEIEGGYYYLEQYAEQTLFTLIEQQQPQQFVMALNHLMKLSKRFGISSRQSGSPNFASSLLTNAIAKEPIAGVAMMAWFLSDPNSEVIDTISLYDNEVRTAFGKSLMQATVGDDADALVESIASISTQLAELTQGADVSSYHYLFQTTLFLNQIRDERLTAVADWARSASGDETVGAIAEQWLIAANLGRLRENAADESVSVDELRSKLVRQLRSETILRSSRSVSGYTLLFRTLKTGRADVAASMDELGRLMKEQPPTSMKPWMTSAINYLNKIEDPSELKEVGLNFAMAIERQAGEIFGNAGVRSVEIQAIRIFHRLERPSGVLAVAKGAGEVAQTPDVVAELTRLGYANVAWGQLNRNWNSIRFAKILPSFELPATEAPDEMRPRARFDAEVETRLPELLQLANHPGTKYLTQLYVSLLLDTDDEAKRPQVARKDRLAELARQFPEQTFNSPDERRFALLLLCQTEDLSDSIATAIDEAVSGLKPFDLWVGRSEDETMARNRRLLITHTAIQLQNGHRESLDKLIEEVGKLDIDHYQTANMVEGAAELLTDELTARITKVPPETIVAVAPDLLKLDAKTSGSSRMRGLLQLWFMVHQRDREFQALVKTPTILRPGAGAATQSDIDDLWPIALRMKPEIVDAAAEERLNLVKSIWQLTKTGAGVGTGHFQQGVKESCTSCSVAKMGLDAIDKSGILSADEVMTIAPELARIDSVKGEIWRQIGHRQMKAEQWVGAENSMRRAVSDTPRSLAPAKANRQVELAWVLLKLGKTDDAKQVIGELKSTDLYGENPQRLTQLKTQLQIE